MKIEIFSLCDAATDQQGKLNFLGSFDHIWAAQVPVSHPSCSLALKLRFSKEEEGSHKIKVTFGDEDGKLVIPPMDVPVNVKIAEGESTASLNLILNMQQLKLTKFGEYTLDMTLDGVAVANLPLYIRKMPPR